VIGPPPGTSAATALWAGLMALAGQDAHHSLGFVNPTIYRLARSPSYHKAFHDVTTGNNLTLGPVSYKYHAGPGWDPVTGWGSPNAHALIPCWPAARHTRIRPSPGVPAPVRLLSRWPSGVC
jgi:subtilase family serine protease